MAKVYQARYFTGEQLDGLMKKVVDKELAGRGLEFDADGNLACTVPGYTKLIYSYTHSGNPEVRPTALDITTGIFTAPDHGLTQNKAIFATVEYPYNIGEPYTYLPKGVILGATTNTGYSQQYYTQLIDKDHFGISTTSGVTDPLTFTENPNMDFSKFHFEHVPVSSLYIEDLDLEECLLVFKGKVRNSIRWVHPSNRIKFGSNGNRTGGVSYDMASGSDSYGSCHLGRPGHNYTYATFEMKMLEKGQAYQVVNMDYICYADTGTTYFRHNRQYFHMLLTSDNIKGIDIYGDNAGGFFNGSTVEVYAR